MAIVNMGLLVAPNRGVSLLCRWQSKLAKRWSANWDLLSATPSDLKIVRLRTPRSNNRHVVEALYGRSLPSVSPAVRDVSLLLPMVVGHSFTSSKLRNHFFNVVSSPLAVVLESLTQSDPSSSSSGENEDDTSPVEQEELDMSPKRTFRQVGGELVTGDRKRVKLITSGLTVGHVPEEDFSTSWWGTGDRGLQTMQAALMPMLAQAGEASSSSVSLPALPSHKRKLLQPIQDVVPAFSLLATSIHPGLILLLSCLQARSFQSTIVLFSLTLRRFKSLLLLNIRKILPPLFFQSPSTYLLTKRGTRSQINFNIPMTDNLENQKALRLASQEDRDGRRTIGVLTKPDMLGHGSTKATAQWLDVIEDRAPPPTRRRAGASSSSLSNVKSLTASEPTPSTTSSPMDPTLPLILPTDPQLATQTQATAKKSYLASQPKVQTQTNRS
ncbi:hypothetical protein D9757_006820 [Collybiopsis confluens]|uniref:Uncharacterized protein n=1 Tax=Collybiopsis confluens TaxID=2823264 RepID=A0A8H5MAZ4_9AGAR|nr:hypothetical protein D9757_006820 [Collybiopsis confluens]